MRVSCAVILENGRILVTKRPEHKHLGSLWEFPGGKLRQGENPKQGLKREIREELGIRISINRLIERVNYSYDPSNQHQLFFYLCQIQKGQPQPREAQPLMWVAPEELKTLEFPPADKELIEILNRCLSEPKRRIRDQS